MLDRRSFLRNAAAAAGMAALLPRSVLAANAGVLPSSMAALRDLEQQLASAPALPPASLYAQNEDRYWEEMRKQFIMPADEVYLNNGTVGSCPLPVLKAVFDGYFDTEKLQQADPEDYPIWGYGPWNEFRDPLAAFVGATRDEIALVRNATEANSFMVNGIDMKAGDEALISDQEHPSGESPWFLKAKRYGVVVKKFEIPKPLVNTADVLNRINDAITPRTRVIFVSHITTTTGVVMPVKEICALARQKGLISMVDGAQVVGQMAVNVKDIGCDMYGSSPHKWLMAPKGSGFLYIRDDMIDRVWSTTTTAGWDDPKLRAARLQQIGSSNVPQLWGLRAAIELANTIGMDRIEARHRKMLDWLNGEMLKRGAQAWTSPDPRCRCAMGAVLTPPLEIGPLERAMWKEHKIRIRGGDKYKIRLSTPYYLLRRDLERFLEAFDEYRKKGLA